MDKINLTPVIAEGGVESAKNFLSKLVTPAFEETGLLIKDHITLWRFNNQVKMINKAKEICEKNHIKPKAVSLKLLIPLLDYSGIEEDEEMQNKWGVLLANLVDSEQNIENHVFPYILSQLSLNEFNILDATFEEKKKRVVKLQNELEEFSTTRPKQEVEINAEIDELKTVLLATSPTDYNKGFELRNKIRDLERKLRANNYKEESLKNSMTKPEGLPPYILKDFEESNLIRLGLIKEVKEFYASSQTLNIPLEPDDRFSESPSVDVNLDINVDSSREIILTQLGELFISTCQEKRKSAINIK